MRHAGEALGSTCSPDALWVARKNRACVLLARVHMMSPRAHEEKISASFV